MSTPRRGRPTARRPARSGDVCATATPADCPTDFTCEVRGAIGGATDRGYCSPVCGGDGDCTDGYAGPGDPTCLGSACIIVCDADCPAGLTCLPTGGPTSICAVAE
jgi:hypothetical protein